MRVLRFLFPVAGLFLLTTPPPAVAQAARPSLDPARPFTQYIHDIWQRTEGLPQNTVMAMAQTADGYVWIATQDGLVRFDGVRFTVFNTRNTPALATDDVQALCRDSQDRLWIGTAGGGLLVLHEGRFTSYGESQGLAGDVVSALHEDAAGTMWVGTLGGGLSRFANGEFRNYSTSDGLVSNDVTAIAHDRGGAIWIATHSGLSKLQNGRFETYDATTGLPSSDVRDVYAARDDSIWIATTGGLARAHKGAFTVYTTRDGLSSNFVRTVLEDRAGTLWVGTADAGLTRMHEGAVARFGTAEGLSDADVRAFLEDEEGNLWIGTNTGGLNRLKNPRVVTYGKPEGLSHDLALAITADAAGSLWVATYGGGLNRLKDDRWSAYSTAHGLASDVVLSLAPARDGSLWIGTRSGVDRLRDGRVEHYGARLGLADEPVLALLEDRRGALWIGTRTGLKHLTAGGVRTHTSADGLGSNVVVAIVQDRQGTLWIGTEGGGLSRLEPGGFRSYTQRDGLPNDIVWTISEGRDGRLWVGTNGGLARLANDRFVDYTRRDGLFDDPVYRILEDRAGNLWMSSNRGISRVRTQDVDDFDAGKLKQIPAVWYDEADGMRSSEANGGIQPAGWQTADGRLWFPTLKGVVMIDPERLARSSQPLQAIVEEVLVDGRATEHRRPLSVPPGARAIEFHYTAPGFRSPHRTAFQYRLEGYDPDWIDAGTRRAAYYTNLPPGDYVFRVIARDEENVWDQTGAALHVNLGPHVYQTASFYALSVLALTLVVFTAHRFRVRGLRAREQELLQLSEERQRALEALRASESQFRALFDNVFEGVYSSTPEGRILLANKAFATLLGYESADQLAGINALDLYVHPEDRGRLIERLVTAGEVREVEVILRRTDGRQITALESARAIRDQDGRVQYFEGTLVDITDRKQLEDQNRQLQKMEVVGRLAGGIAHDFNNLLTPILGYCDMLLEDLPRDARYREDVEEIRRAAESAGSLTGQLLAFSRQQIVEPHLLDINELTLKIEKILRRLIGEHIGLRLHLDPAAGRIKADAGQIEQVLLNLVINARDAMGGGGTVTIETARVTLGSAQAQPMGLAPGIYVTLAVSDTGPGIAPELRSQLFQPFFTTKRHGTGLGLSTVHDIVTQSGGQIVAESEPGLGATFTAYLPYVDAQPDDDAPRTSMERPAGTETVLLAEDNDSLRELARKILERRGYTVLPATNASEARDVAARHTGRIDLLLTDVVMPGASGPALAAELLEQRPGLKVLYMTGYIDDDIRAVGAPPVGSALQKPFPPTVLLGRVREILDQDQDP